MGRNQKQHQKWVGKVEKKGGEKKNSPGKGGLRGEQTGSFQPRREAGWGVNTHELQLLFWGVGGEDKG